MCLIVVKPRGKGLPEPDSIARWFKSHPDGFGLTFPWKDKVRILKGAMTLEETNALLVKVERMLKDELLDTPIVLHFRQSTGGIIEPKNCHPFPITKNQRALASLDYIADASLAHNGIIECAYTTYKTSVLYKETEKTDTQQFIEDYLVPLGDKLKDQAVQNLVVKATESKFALTYPNKVCLLGGFIEEDGYYYSNGGYKELPPLATKNYVETSYFEREACDCCKQEEIPLYYTRDYDVLCRDCYVQITGIAPDDSKRVPEEDEHEIAYPGYNYTDYP